MANTQTQNNKYKCPVKNCGRSFSLPRARTRHLSQTHGLDDETLDRLDWRSDAAKLPPSDEVPAMPAKKARGGKSEPAREETAAPRAQRSRARSAVATAALASEAKASALLDGQTYSVGAPTHVGVPSQNGSEKVAAAMQVVFPDGIPVSALDLAVRFRRVVEDTLTEVNALVH